jgi:HK97 family phage major capsid protein
MSGERGGTRRVVRTGVHRRALELVRRADGRAAVDEEARTVEVAFSSEAPVDRYWGREVLDHSPEAVDLSRLADGRAPVLLNHRLDDQVGVIERAWIDRRARRGYAVLRLSRSTRGEEILRDLADGIRSQVSVGYAVLRAVLEETGGEDGDVYRVTSWRPLEVSIVSLAADPTVGVGRGADGETFETVLEVPERAPEGGGIMQTRGAAGGAGERVEVVETPADRREWNRSAEILAVAERWGCREEGLEAIARGRSAAEFKGWVLEHKVPRGEPLATPTSAIGIGGRELGDYSLRRAILAMIDKDWSRAPLELEASRAVERATGQTARGIMVPWEVLSRRIEVPGLAVRAAVAKAGSGANLVATDLMPQAFIEVLRNRMQVREAGATVLSGLVGDVAIPRRTGAAAAAWVDEGAGSGDTPQTYDQVTLAPKTVRARSDMTRKMLLQTTPAIEQLTRDDLARVLALAIDLAALHGSGSDPEPRGVANVVGIGSVAVGANGGAPTWDHIVGLETEVAADNADDGSLAYITNSKVRGKLKRTEKAATTGQFVWGDALEATLNGYRALVSNQVRSNITKGSGSNLSACFFGNWADLLIGEWGVLDVFAENVTLGDSGGVVVRAFMDVDVAVRHPESFSLASDFATT